RTSLVSPSSATHRPLPSFPTRRSSVLSSSFTAATPAPTAFLTRLGLRADRVQVDTLLVPDPGPSYRFPETPVLGWRLDTTAHGLDRKSTRLTSRHVKISYAVFCLKKKT